MHSAALTSPKRLPVRALRAFAPLVLLFAASPLFAQVQVCAADLDGDGDADQGFEHANCTSYPSGQHCPIGAAACTRADVVPPPLVIDRAVARIVNDDAPLAPGAFQVSGGSVPEGASGNASMVFTVSLTIPPSTPLNASYSTVDVTAAAGSDYVATSGTLTFDAASMSQTVAVPVLGDTVLEADESFQLMVWETGDPSLSNFAEAIIVNDEDTAAAATGISISAPSRAEGSFGSTPWIFTVTLAPASPNTVTVQYTTVNGTALAGSDYTAASGVVTFPPGVTTQFIEVSVAGDGDSEVDEGFAVELAAVTAIAPLSCPTDSARLCLEDGAGAAFCSPHDCFLQSGAGSTITDFPSENPANDGPRDANGNCLGQLQIFPGKALRCREAGTQTVFTNCCRNEGSSLEDTMGGLSSLTIQGQVLSSISEAAAAAVGGGSGAASQVLMASFDPTTMAIAVALTVITELLLDGCDQRDVETALLSSSQYCVALGNYCAESWPVVGCVQRSQSFCCYNSKLARIIQEQGRAQIPSMGGFGTPQAPNCRGFTPEEFQSIDFSKVDLSEYQEEIRTKTQAMIEGEIRTEVQSEFEPIP